MNSDQTGADRATQFRQALVATANLGPYVRRRPPLRLVIASIAAFAIAGSLTGAAVATTGTPNPKVAAAIASSAAAATEFAHSSLGKLVGTPFTLVTSGNGTLDLGSRPAGATGIVENFECIEPAGSVTLFLDGKDLVGYPDCAPGGSGGAIEPLTTPGDHRFTVSSKGAGRYVLWVSWISQPKLVDSAAQNAELADGTVTRDEDVAAFNRYEGCMGALGHPVDFPTTRVVPNYTTGGAEISDGSDYRCYRTEFSDVDTKWQFEIRDTNVAEKSVDACIAAKGFKPAATPEARSEQLFTLNLNLTDCTWIG